MYDLTRSQCESPEVEFSGITSEACWQNPTTAIISCGNISLTLYQETEESYKSISDNEVTPKMVAGDTTSLEVDRQTLASLRVSRVLLFNVAITCLANQIQILQTL